MITLSLTDGQDRAMRGAFADKIPADVSQTVRETKQAIDWNAPFHPSDDLRVTIPIAKANTPRKVRQHLADMPEERREALEREWLDAEAAVPSVCEPVSPELRERARIEWEQS